MPSTTVAMSNVQNIDALLSGVRWTDGRVTFSFPTTAAAYGNNYARNVDHDDNPATPAVLVNETTGFQAMNAAQMEAGRDVFHSLSLLTNYTTREWDPPGDADVRLAMSTTRTPGNTTAYNAYPDNDARGGDGWFNTTAYNTPNVGTYAYQTFFHEIGHGLGLKHGHEGDNGNNQVLSGDRDSQEFSVMTYRSFVGSGTGNYSVVDGHYPQSYMMLDIQALQYMYGASFSTYAGDNTYRFDPNTGEMWTDIDGFHGVPQDNNGNNTNVLFRTIWDGNGRDTYDFSAYDATHQMRIDLAPGGWTDVDADSNVQAADLNGNAPGTQMARGQVFNALQSNNDPRSLIENAIAGAGDDVVRGNAARNRLEGRAGNDVLEGLDNDDTLVGGSGADAVYGGAGYDTADYSTSSGPVWIEDNPAMGRWDGKIIGGDGDGDTLVDIEAIVASPYDDTLRTGAGNQALYGGDGSDHLQGGAGADYLHGGEGHDSVTFTSAVNINLSSGVHSGEAAGDTYISVERYVGSGQADTMVASNFQRAEFAGGDGADALYGGSGHDWLQGGRGEDVLNGGNGFDIVSYADAPHYITAELYMKDATHDGKITAGEWGYDTLVDIEGVEGTSFDDALYGDDDGNTLIGLAGNDTLEGRGASDTLEGGAGNDSLDGGIGNDALYGQHGDDVLWVGPGADVMDGGDGRDTMAFARSMVADWQAGVLDPDIAADAWTAWEVIQGAGGADRIRTNSWGYDVELRGGGGDDVLACGNGNDTLRGEAGVDCLSGGAGIDLLAGGAGDDRFLDGAAFLNGDSLADFAIGDRIEVSAAQFEALRYTGASGLLELDSAADGSYATQLNLPAGLVGEFVAFLRNDAAGLWTEVRLMADTDGDGVGDFRDNAVDVANPDQRDSNGDGYGNVVDPDLNQDLVVDLLDLSLFEAVFDSGDADADFNGDGSVDLLDLSVLDAYFGGPPGRSYVDLPPAAAPAAVEALVVAALPDEFATIFWPGDAVPF